MPVARLLGGIHPQNLREDMMIENQFSIALWAEETFGKSTQLRSATRMNEEVAELLSKMSNATVIQSKIIEEVADIQITLYTLAERLMMNLDAEVQKKMVVNRNRKWKLDGSGCGQHVDE
jgi:NTP pyrophosphatase (non-canonical NTP hydrolase)